MAIVKIIKYLNIWKLKPEELTLDLALRIIQYKKIISKQYLVPKEVSCGSDCDEDGDKSDGKIPDLKMTKKIKFFLNKIWCYHNIF